MYIYRITNDYNMFANYRGAFAGLLKRGVSF